MKVDVRHRHNGWCMYNFDVENVVKGMVGTYVTTLTLKNDVNRSGGIVADVCSDVNVENTCTEVEM